MTSELLNALAQTTLATGFTFLCTAAGAAAVFFMKPGNGRGRGAELAETLSLGFAAGIMIAASVWSLIIPAQEMAQAQGGTPWLPETPRHGASAPAPGRRPARGAEDLDAPSDAALHCDHAAQRA